VGGDKRIEGKRRRCSEATEGSPCSFRTGRRGSKVCRRVLYEEKKKRKEKIKKREKIGSAILQLIFALVVATEREKEVEKALEGSRDRYMF